MCTKQDFSDQIHTVFGPFQHQTHSEMIKLEFSVSFGTPPV